MRRSLLVTVASLASVVALAAVYLLTRAAPEGEPFAQPTLSREDLEAVSEARILFAHQSVGADILDGVETVYAAQGLSAPQPVEYRGEESEGALLHLRIGRNGDPLGKIEAFDALVRGEPSGRLDAALLKLCYEDIQAGTDVPAVFNAYREALTDLRRDHPRVAIVAATVPVSTQRGPLGTLKSWLGRGDRFGPEHNVAREEFNALVRAEFGGDGLLFDVAALESTTPAGERVTGRHGGGTYYALHRGFAADPGHLNTTGAAAVARGLLAVVGDAVQER